MLPDQNKILESIQQKSSNYLRQNSASFPSNAEPLDRAIEQLPNSERLTPAERWIYGKLPGFSQSTVGKALSAFNEGWAGKLLSKLDILAEGTERTAGLVQQIADDPTFRLNKDNLTAAWYAGSLFGDVNNLPTLKRDANGKIVGLTVPTDLPGTGGLSEARMEIARLIEGGMDPGDALVSVRDQYYNNLGALGLRAGLYDTYFHVLADPLNYILPALKPVEAIKARAITAATSKVSNSLDEIADLERLARITGDTEAAERWASVAQRVQSGELKTLDAVDRAALALTSGEALKGLRKIPGLNIIPKALELTPEAKAHEAIVIMDDALGSGVVSRVFNNTNAEKDFVEAITRVGEGAVGKDNGHLFLSLEGRTAQAFARGAGEVVQPIYKAYTELAPQRALLNTIAQSIGIDSAKVLKMAQEDSEGLFRLIASNPNLAPLIQQINPDTLRSLGLILKDMPINKEMFFAEAMGAIAEHAMRQAVTQFGVKARGPFMRWIGAIKAAENLAFLRTGNAGYVVRNFLNNEFTMLGRGVFGAMSGEDVSKFWKAQGFIPKRLADDLTIADAEEFAKGASSVLRDALRGGNYGAPEKITDFIQNLSAGKLDTGQAARAIERSARGRSMTVGYNQWFDNYSKPTPLSKALSSTDYDAIRRIDPEAATVLENAVRSARGSEQKLEELLKTNLHLNTNSVLDEASRQLGYKIEDALDTETLAFIHQNLPEAVKNGKVDEFVLQVRNKIDGHIEDLFQKQIQDIADDVSARVQLGGPKAHTDAFQELQHAFWSAETEHAIRTPRAARLAREAEDYAKSDALWEKHFSDEDRLYDRAWRKYDAVMGGLNEGGKALRKKGINVPLFEESRAYFGEWRRGWKQFFQYRQKQYRAFFEAARSGKKVDWKALQADMNARYRALIEQETELMAKMDKSIASQLSGPDRKVFEKAREIAAELRKADKEALIRVREEIEELGNPTERFQKFWQERQLRYNEMYQVDRASVAASQGDPNARALFEGLDVTPEEAAKPISETPLVDEYLLDEGPTSRAPFMADETPLLPKMTPMAQALDEMAYGRSYAALDTIADGARTQTQKTPLLLENLPENLQKKVLQYIERAKDDMAADRFAATRFAEFRSDSALLNYNRRTNFDTWMSTVFPYALWTTGSMAKWALHSIDRPAMLTTYLRTKKFMETSGLPQQGLPGRVKGQIRVNLPYAPAWLGDQFVDPLGLALPFETFAQPYEQYQRNQMSLEGRAERELERRLTSGQISEAEYNDAVNNHSGATWDSAVSKAQEDDENLRFDAWDFASLFSSPHAPLAWAYNAAMGHPEDIGAFTPLSRTFRNVATVLGVNDWNNSDWNVEAKVRRQLGLPAFDKWDDYRIDRSLSNLAADGKYSYEDISRAMALSSALQSGQISREEAMQDPAWEVYQDGVTHANREYAGGPSAVLLKLLGIPVNSYPVGEQKQRELQDDFSRAYQAYNKGDVDALTNFFDEHPEYEARLALFKKPEERLKNFMIDEVWSRWNEMPKVNRDEVADQMGPSFNDAFLDKETRSYDSIDPVQLQVWLKLMGGKPIGTLTADQKMLLEFNQLRLTKPETAWRAQVFYDARTQNFPGWYETQNGYYNLPKAQRRTYLTQHPELKEYWGWRREFMEKNPDLVPYLTDDEKAIERASQQVRVPEQAVPTENEILSSLSPAMQALLQQGGEIPYPVTHQLDLLAEQYGMEPEQLYRIAGIE